METSSIDDFISIHALLAESDSEVSERVPLAEYFYPRSPCGERQHAYQLVLWVLRFLSTLSLRRATDTSSLMQCQAKFLSTLSLRRATCYSLRHSAQSWHFYPRSPCGERRNSETQSDPVKSISIHALLAESDNGHETTPYRVVISIHALLAESDKRGRELLQKLFHFYPRSPCGERPPRGRSVLLNNQFLSTLSLRRATKPRRLKSRRCVISIHALLAESDPVR